MEQRLQRLARICLTPFVFVCAIILAANIENVAENMGWHEIIALQGQPLITALSSQWFAFLFGILTALTAVAWLPVALQHVPEKWNLRFIRLKQVRGKQFRNCTIELDGHHYSHCTFINVTFRYGGGRFGLEENTIEGVFIEPVGEKQINVVRLLYQLGFTRFPMFSPNGQVAIENNIGGFGRKEDSDAREKQP